MSDIINHTPEITSTVEHVANRPEPAVVEPDCPKCTGHMVRCEIGHVGIYGWWLEREIRQAGALGPPRMTSSEVAAWVCIRCGYTEIYAQDPQALAGGEDHN